MPVNVFLKKFRSGDHLAKKEASLMKMLGTFREYITNTYQLQIEYIVYFVYILDTFPIYNLTPTMKNVQKFPK